MDSKKRIGVFISGRGSNFRAINEEIKKGSINGKIVVVVSDNPEARGLVYARDEGIPFHVFIKKKEEKREDYFGRIMNKLKEYQLDLILLAGFMRVLSSNIINEYKNRIINIHPALLPSFPGVHAQKRALEYGVKVSGCTVHFVDEGVDTGPIIIQKTVQVYDDDTEETLADRILKQEHRAFPEAVRLFCENRLLIRGRKVIVIR